MPIIQVDVTLEDWLAAPEWQRDKTNSGRLMLVAKNEPEVDVSEIDYRILTTKGRIEKFVQVGHHKGDHYDFEVLMNGEVIGIGNKPEVAWKAAYYKLTGAKEAA